MDRAFARRWTPLLVLGAAFTVGCQSVAGRGESPMHSTTAALALRPGTGSRVLAPLEPEAIAFAPADELTPTLDPTGRFLVFVGTEAGGTNLFQKDLETGVVEILVEHPADDLDPSFSPRSRRLVFASRRADAKGDLWLLDDGQLRRLTFEATADREPVFAPDEASVYFTTAPIGGEEYVARLRLDDGRLERISPTAGFDPAPSPDGRFVVYTAAAGEGGRQSPHLVALRLTDGATRALTLDETPDGLSRFGDPETLFVVRFVEDTDGDGVVDASDQASLWRYRIRWEALFVSAPGSAVDRTPLTSGARDELFPAVSGPWLYFTQSSGDQQDIVRLPLSGAVPDGVGATALIAAARDADDPAVLELWLRAAEARSEATLFERLDAGLRLAEHAHAVGRPDLAARRLEPVLRALEGGSNTGSVGLDRIDRLDRLAALARLLRLALDREAIVALSLAERPRAARLDAVDRSLDALERRGTTDAEVAARIELERAEVVAARGDRFGSAERLEALAARHATDAPELAARAWLRRAELLSVAEEASAVLGAFMEVRARFPDARAAGREAAERAVGHVVRWTERIEGEAGVVVALRRLVTGSEDPLFRAVTRARLAAALEAEGQPRLAEDELEALAREGERDGEVAAAQRAWARVAELAEREGELERARAAHRALLERHAAVPGVSDRARAALIRLDERAATQAEEAGDLAAGRDALQRVLDIDPARVSAIRSFVRLSASTGRLDAALERARGRARQAPGAAVERYGLALALAWMNPPAFDEAEAEVAEALRQNPTLAAGYLVRGWVREMRAARPEDVISSVEAAITDYRTGLRLARVAGDQTLVGDLLLNLGHARWRLGDRTNDVKNLQFAMRDYLELIELGRVPRDPGAALVFWERLSRAALWSDDPRRAAEAASKALAIEGVGDARRAQLLGNLALARAQLGEAEAAERTFREFEAALSSRGASPRRLRIARRNLALGQIQRERRTGEGDLRGALDELERARGTPVSGPILEGTGDLITMTTADGTRAPFGFDDVTELGVSLALSSVAHGARGDRSAHVAVDAERRVLLGQLVANRKPLTLGVIREWLGLELSALAQACVAAVNAPALQRCRAGFAEVIDRLEAAAGDETLVKVVPELRVEAARALAIWLETAARRPELAPSPELEARVAAAAEQVLRTALLGPTRSATVALGRTSTTALFEQPAAVLAALATTARLAVARALDDAAVEPALEGEPIERLDRAARGRVSAARAFAGAADRVRGIETPTAIRVFAWAQTLQALTDPRLDRAATLAELGPLLDGIGDSALALRLAARLATEGRGTPQVVDAAWRRLEATPASLLSTFGDAELDLVRKVVAARVDAGDLPGALAALDRGLLLRAVAGRFDAITRALAPGDATFLADYRAALARDRAAREMFAPIPDEGALAARGRLDQARAQLGAARARLTELAEAGGSAALSARALGVPADADAIGAALEPSDRLLAPVPLGPRLGWLVVGTSTDAPSVPIVVDTGVTWTDAREALVRGSAAEALVAPLWKALGSGAQGLRWSVTAGLLGDVAVPWRALLGAPVSELAAPTGLVVSAGARRSASGPALVLAASTTTTAPGRSDRSDRLDAAALGGWGRAVSGPEPTERHLSARPPAEQLRGTTVARLIVDAPVRLGDLERGRLVALARDGRAVGPSVGDLELSAELAVFTRVERGLDETGLELSLAPLGVSSALLIPAELDEPVRAELVERLAQGASPAVVLETLAARAPALRRARLIGAPVLEGAERAAWAKRQLGPDQGRVRQLFLAGRFRDVLGFGPVLLGRMQAAGASAKSMVDALLLIRAAAERVDAWVRAADLHARQVTLLDTPDATPEARRLAIRERLAYAVTLSRARDFDEASAQIDRALGDARRAGAAELEPRAFRQRAEIEIRRDRQREAAQALEAAVEGYQKLNACAKPGPLADEAFEAASRLGTHALNRLADPARAELAYTAALRCATRDDQRVGTALDLARVARRRGAFDAAAGHAEAARAGARGKLPDIEVRAVIEAANVAWFRGDLARGDELGRESLRLATERLAAVREKKLASDDAQVRQLIYACSVVGLLHMSSGRFHEAESTLERAAQLAAGLANRPQGEARDAAEEANQYNNLGRVYLEFGRADRALRAFQKAQAIDERIDDRFGQAYDLRNVGTALFALGQLDAAERTLRQGVSAAEAVADDNSRLRASFALAELLRASGHGPEAARVYLAALPLAEAQANQELAWQIQRALGLLAWSAGDRAEAERRLREAVQTTQGLGGRALGSDFGPYRYAAFDDLARILLEQGRTEDALAAVERARALALADSFDDQRLALATGPGASALRALRVARTGTVAPETGATVARVAPGLPRLLEVPRDVVAASRALPGDAALVVMRPTGDELLAFVVRTGTIAVVRTSVRAAALAASLERLEAAFDRRAEVGALLLELGRLIRAPLEPSLRGVRRTAWVTSGGLRRVPLAALRATADGDPWVAQLSFVHATHVRAGLAALIAPASSSVRGLDVAHVDQGPGGRPRLAFPAREARVIREAIPTARIVGDAAVSSTWLESRWRASGAHLHFAGHAEASAADPLGSAFVAADGLLPLHRLLATPGAAELHVWSSCGLFVDEREGSERWALGHALSGPEAALIFGAHRVLTTQREVDDLASARFMKHFYRFIAARGAEGALQATQQRASTEHPAEWASYVLWVGD